MGYVGRELEISSVDGFQGREKVCKHVLHTIYTITMC
jgi:hypothetical protein